MGTTAGFAAGSLMTFGVFLGVIVFTEPPPSSRGVASVSVVATKSSRPIVVSANSWGMFYVEGRINDDVQVRFLIDTGATYTSIMYRDAQRLREGLKHGPTIRISTGNGVIEAPRVLFSRLQIGHIVLDDVDGIIESQRASLTGVLGMSFLKKIKKWEGQ